MNKLAVVLCVFGMLFVSEVSVAAKARKIRKPTPTTYQLLGSVGSFQGGQTIASLPRPVKN